jgi:hypothetical protein
MNNEGAFTRLVDLIGNPKSDAKPGLHRLFMELLYEMARIQRVKIDDLSMSMLPTLLRGRPGCSSNPFQPKLILLRTVHVDDAFVRHLFQIIEELSDDVNDPYHYPVIRVLVRHDRPHLAKSNSDRCC